MIGIRVGRPAGRSPGPCEWLVRVRVKTEGESLSGLLFTRTRTSHSHCSGGKSGLHRARWWVTPTPGNGSVLPGAGRQRAGQCNRKDTACGEGKREKDKGKSETVIA